MKKAHILASLGLVTTFSAAALAGPEWTTSWELVDRLESFGDDIHIFGVNLSLNPAGCASTSLAKVRYSLSATTKEQLAFVLMSAHMSGLKVKLRLEDNFCQDGYPSVIGVQIDNP